MNIYIYIYAVENGDTIWVSRGIFYGFANQAKRKIIERMILYRSNLLRFIKNPRREKILNNQKYGIRTPSATMFNNC